MMKIVEIKLVDGIPCIVVEDGIFWSKEMLKTESRKLIMPDYFTLYQQDRENTYYKGVLDELKKRFGEK